MLARTTGLSGCCVGQCGGDFASSRQQAGHRASTGGAPGVISSFPCARGGRLGWCVSALIRERECDTGAPVKAGGTAGTQGAKATPAPKAPPQPKPGGGKAKAMPTNVHRPSGAQATSGGVMAVQSRLSSHNVVEAAASAPDQDPAATSPGLVATKAPELSGAGSMENLQQMESRSSLTVGPTVSGALATVSGPLLLGGGGDSRRSSKGEPMRDHIRRCSNSSAGLASVSEMPSSRHFGSKQKPEISRQRSSAAADAGLPAELPLTILKAVGEYNKKRRARALQISTEDLSSKTSSPAQSPRLYRSETSHTRLPADSSTKATQKAVQPDAPSTRPRLQKTHTRPQVRVLRSASPKNLASPENQLASSEDAKTALSREASFAFLRLSAELEPIVPAEARRHTPEAQPPVVAETSEMKGVPNGLPAEAPREPVEEGTVELPRLPPADARRRSQHRGTVCEDTHAHRTMCSLKQSLRAKLNCKVWRETEVKEAARREAAEQKKRYIELHSMMDVIKMAEDACKVEAGQNVVAVNAYATGPSGALMQTVTSEATPDVSAPEPPEQIVEQQGGQGTSSGPGYTSNDSTANDPTLKSSLKSALKPVQSGDLKKSFKDLASDLAPSLSLLFNEVVNVPQAERDMRMVARRNGINLLEAEEVWMEFQRFDSSGRGSLSYNDFAQVVRSMAVRRGMSVAGRPIGNATDMPAIPESRIRHLWHDVDSDGSGRVEFEEFLLWFHTTFNQGQDEAETSLHSNRPADSVTERFYASMGRNRLRNMYLALQYAACQYAPSQ